jgi:hypothetical protein
MKPVVRDADADRDTDRDTERDLEGERVGDCAPMPGKHSSSVSNSATSISAKMKYRRVRMCECLFDGRAEPQRVHQRGRMCHVSSSVDVRKCSVHKRGARGAAAGAGAGGGGGGGARAGCCRRTGGHY